MTNRRGGVYLANLNPSKGTEPGKIRPCLVIQNDLLSESGHTSTVVLPMSSRLIEGAEPIRITIKARDRLKADSQILVDQPRAIDNRRFSSDLLTELTPGELVQVEECLKIVLGMEA
jgi:mRNA interferase MazF